MTDRITASDIIAAREKLDRGPEPVDPCFAFYHNGATYIVHRGEVTRADGREVSADEALEILRTFLA